VYNDCEAAIYGNKFMRNKAKVRYDASLSIVLSRSGLAAGYAAISSVIVFLALAKACYIMTYHLTDMHRSEQCTL
jgi:hypothetical protein